MKIRGTVFAILAILVGSECFIDDFLAHLAVRCTAYAADGDTFNNNKTHIFIRRSSTEENLLKKTEFELFWFFTYLRSFIGNEKFDVDTFAHEREVLRDKIQDMYSRMEVSTKYFFFFVTLTRRAIYGFARLSISM